MIILWKENLFNHVNIKPENTHLPNGMADDIEKSVYELWSFIDAAGGIDVQVLGIGRNAHIGLMNLILNLQKELM